MKISVNLDEIYDAAIKYIAAKFSLDPSKLDGEWMTNDDNEYIGIEVEVPEDAHAKSQDR